MSYQSRRYQRRLLMMVGALVLVLVAVSIARDPVLWEFFARGGRPAGAAPEKKPLDFGIRLEDDEPLKPGEFRSRPRIPRRGNEGPAEAELPSDGGAGTTPSADDADDITTEIDPAWLRAVRDNTIGVRRDEADAFYAMLAMARDVPQSRLERDSMGRIDFRVLMADSESLRGRLVTIEGELKRLLPFDADANDFGVQGLYEAWLVTDEEPAHPVRIVFTDRPADLPDGESIPTAVRVKATGYFFKREGYASQGGMHIAPLILAKRVTPLRIVAQGPPPVPKYLAPTIITVALSIAGIFGLMVWQFSRGDRAFKQKRRQRMLDDQGKRGAATFDGIVAVDPAELLRQLAEEERRADADGDDDSE